MSRSYKKTPISKLQNDKTNKKIANKRVRRMLKNSDMKFNNKTYKKAFCSYDICDYKFFQTKEQTIAFYNKLYANNYYGFREEFPTLESFIQDWKKYYLRK